MQITFMKDSRNEHGKIVSVPWPGEIVEKMSGGARVRFIARDGEQREYFVPNTDIVKN